MKIPALLTVMALACGVAFAQTHSGAAERGKTGKASQSATVASSDTKGEGIGAKTKRTFQRMGDKIRNTGDRIARKTGTDNKSDTRSMGAAGSDAADSGRRARMDEAYDNWKSRQK